MKERDVSDLARPLNGRSWYLYGSGAWHPDTARDFDILCCSTDIDAPICETEKIDIQSFSRISNIYYIPSKVFEDDCFELAYGGYYSMKFALSFRRIRESLQYDPATVYWESQLSWVKSIIETNEIDCLIKTVHFLILHYNPTFFRSLLRFVNSRDFHVLKDWIEDNVDIFGLKPRTSPNIIVCHQKIMYLFWKEYHRHKDKGLFPGINTISKLNRSLSEFNRRELNGYFDDIPSIAYDLTK